MSAARSQFRSTIAPEVEPLTYHVEVTQPGTYRFEFWTYQQWHSMADHERDRDASHVPGFGYVRYSPA